MHSWKCVFSSNNCYSAVKLKQQGIKITRPLFSWKIDLMSNFWKNEIWTIFLTKTTPHWLGGLKISSRSVLIKILRGERNYSKVRTSTFLHCIPDFLWFWNFKFDFDVKLDWNAFHHCTDYLSLACLTQVKLLGNEYKNFINGKIKKSV